MTDTGPGTVILALDTAGLDCSVAVAIGDQLVGARRIDRMHGQAESLLPMVDSLMVEACLPPTALDVVVTTLGPGSFTGIRVGLAAANGIALGSGARLIGVTSFEAAVAASLPHDYRGDVFLLIALESRREDLYAQFFNGRRDAIGAPAAVMPARLGHFVDATIGPLSLLIGGDAAQRAGRALSERPNTSQLKVSTPNAVGAWRAALGRLRRGETSSTIRPLYLRPPDATLPTGDRAPALSPA